MTLAIFDLDNTLLNGDSDYEWGQFLVNKGVVDSKTYEEANNHFLEQYQQGKLDIYEFARFAFKPLAENSLETLLEWRDEFMLEVIHPRMSTKAKALVQSHKDRHDTTLVITATNSFITAPIVTAFGIPNLIATEPKRDNDAYIAEIDGIPCFQEGKVKRLELWLKERDEDLAGSTFYSDSRNDLPLLEMVDIPVAVDPDDSLREVATQRGWKILSLHD